MSGERLLGPDAFSGRDRDRFRQYEVDPNEEIGLSIVRAVAARSGSDPRSVDPPLGSRIDVEALGSVLENSTTELIVSFEFSGYEIVLTGENIHVARASDD